LISLPFSGFHTGIRLRFCLALPCFDSKMEYNALRQHHLLDSHGLGQVARHVDVQALGDGKPVRHQLQRDDVQ